MKVILITGGAGFVGSSLAMRYKQDNPNVKVIALDNLKRRGSELNIPRLRDCDVQFVHGDIRNIEDIKNIGPFDLMIECSAEPSVLSGYNESPAYVINTNLLGTINCLEVVRKYKADILFLSSSRVYPIKAINGLEYIEHQTRFELALNQGIKGVSPSGFSEEFALDGIRSFYGATKLASELLLQEYMEAYGIRGIINRCSILTGPWQMGKVDQGVVALWVTKHLYNGKLAYIGYGGKGKQLRDILHIDDLYNLISLQIRQMNLLNGEIYNIGGGKNNSISLFELSQLCQEVTGKKIPIDSVPDNRVADIPYYVTDCTKVQRATGWSPKITLKRTIQDISHWITSNTEILRPILY